MSPTPNPTFPLLTSTCACLAILLAGTSWDVRCLGHCDQGCATTPEYDVNREGSKRGPPGAVRRRGPRVRLGERTRLSLDASPTAGSTRGSRRCRRQPRNLK